MDIKADFEKRAKIYLATLFSSPRRILQTLIGVLTLLKLLTHLPWAVRSFVSFPISTIFSPIGLIIALLFVSGSVGVLSLLRDRPRGFNAYYAYAFVATFGMASFVTLFPTGLFPAGIDIRLVTAALIAYNLSACLFVGWLQIRAFEARAPNTPR